MVLDMPSLRARLYMNPSIRANARVAPKWTRTSIESINSLDHDEIDRPSATGGVAHGLFKRVSP